ncbi:MAG: tRNA (N6-isopentenyl adenosine(37)-C2)-methylthiotransferase MiaB [Holosporales bacterium]|jgi:tRNA-2-methylthio-N6-dimethylallyladenosine synthase|nr:tRNA (N6-isopentenyl adenosine(37)-C2)-methylthiotransferase MiaB [Holosporales bacterium]
MYKGVWIKTYGCQMNVYDSNKIISLLIRNNFHQVDSCQDKACGVVIFNTCHIRDKADQKLFSDIGRLKEIRDKRLKEGLPFVTVVTGCIAQGLGGEIVRRSGNVDIVMGVQSAHKLPEAIESIQVQQKAGRKYAPIVSTGLHNEEKFKCFSSVGMSHVGPCAFVTVQEGCKNFCSYCVVPKTRGTEYSRPLAGIKEEIELLIQNGVQEITLGGQNVNAYDGMDANGNKLDLVDLIEEVAKYPEISRIRFLSSHPCNMSKRLIEAFGRVPALMPALHLPIQSGSDRVLKMMNRHYDCSSYTDIIAQLRDVCPKIAISSDFIVGFPSETDGDFEATIDLAKQIKFAKSYYFKFSPRPNTPAESMPDQVPEKVKEQRLAALQDLLDRQQQDFNNESVGSVQPVLFERFGRYDGQVIGRTPYNQPVYIDSDEGLIGHTRQVHIASLDKHSLSGTLI